MCQKLIFLFAKYSQGNFSPGSFFLSGAISEWPKIFFELILYFLIKDLLNFIKDLIWKLENFLYPCLWPGLVISIPIEFLFKDWYFFQNDLPACHAFLLKGTNWITSPDRLINKWDDTFRSSKFLKLSWASKLSLFVKNEIT